MQINYQKNDLLFLTLKKYAGLLAKQKTLPPKGQGYQTLKTTINPTEN